MTDAFDLVIHHLQAVSTLIHDKAVNEIQINCGGEQIFYERDGQLHEYHRKMTAHDVAEALIQIARLTTGGDISPEKPILNARLKGMRISGTLDPISVDGPSMCIRKFSPNFRTLTNLFDAGSITAEQHNDLVRLVEQRETILISGGTTTGKTTLLNALAQFIPPDERIVTIEDTAELLIPHMNIVRFEAREALDGLPAVTIRDLVKHSLRYSPGRLIVGEVRGPEAYDLLQALNSGHQGSLTTIHADSAEEAITKLVTYTILAQSNLTESLIRKMIGSSVSAVVQLAKRSDGFRYLKEIGYVSKDGCQVLPRMEVAA